MHKRMTRILSTLSLLAVLPAVASASPARVQALNVPGDYIKDYTGIYTYVSGVGSVGNLVYVEPTAGNESMGAVLGNLWEGRVGTWAIHMRRFHPSLGQATSIESATTTFLGGPFDDPNSNGEAVDLMWGHKMGSGSLGLRLNRSFISREVTAGTAEGNGSFGRNIWGIGAGFGFQMNDNTDVELAGLFQNRSFSGTNLTTPDAASDDGGSTYMVAGRMMMKSSGNLMWMPVGKIYSFDESSVDAAAVRIEQKLSGWEAGIAGNWSIASDDLLVIGLQVAGNKVEQTVGAGAKTELNETFYPNAFMALEAHVNSWLTLRFGAQNAVLYSVKQESGAPVVTITNKLHAFTYDMGAGVKVGSLMLDATVTPNFWNNPVSAVWNNGLGGNPFPRVSATYSF